MSITDAPSLAGTAPSGGGYAATEVTTADAGVMSVAGNYSFDGTVQTLVHSP